MEHLDNKPQFINPFETFWTSLIKKINNPALNIIAEQANWQSLGEEYSNKVIL